MIDAILTLLEGDATLAALLTGGVHRAQEISRQTTPAAFDAYQELKPCALVKLEAQSPFGPHDHSARLYVTIWFYQRSGYATIDAARERVYVLLHREKLTPEGSGGCLRVDHANDLLDMEEDALQAAMQMSRYVATIVRE